MKRLFLMRHAKSSWKVPSLGDHDRPLNARGRYTAALMSSVLADSYHLPQLIYSSSAERALETATILQQSWPVQIAREETSSLYMADAKSIVEHVRGKGDLESVLLLAHNPGLEDLLVEIMGVKHLKFPTAAVAVFESPEDWQSITYESLRACFRSVLIPKQLPAYQYRRE